MDPQELLRNKLIAYFENAKTGNPQFSLRAFAIKLKVPPGNLSQFISGKRKFSAQTIRQIVHLISNSPEERKNILHEINEAELELTKATKNKPNTTNYDSKTLSAEEFLKLDEWYYYALRTILSLKNVKFEIDWLASKLGINLTEADQALKLLFKLGLIHLASDGRITRTNKHLMTPDSVAIQGEIQTTKIKIHQQHIEHALNSLIKHDPGKRDITWVNIPANVAKLEQARELIRKFQDDMLDLLEDSESSEVMRLTIQLCPLS